MRCRKAILGLGLLGLSISASAQTPESVVENGSTILGLGAMTSLDIVSVNNAKMWMAVIDTTWSDTNQDGVLLRSGFATVREGMFFAAPAGSWLDEMDSLSINNRGNIAMAARARQPGVAGAVEAVAFNLKFVLLKGAPYASPFAPAAAVWDTVDFVRINDNNTVLAVGSLRVPSRQSAAEKLHLDDFGNVLSKSYVANFGQPIPSLPGVQITAFLANESSVAMNNHGDIVSYNTTTGGNMILLNVDQVLARESEASPIPGRTWRTLSVTRNAINDRGDYVLSGNLNGDTTTAYLIVKNGQKFAQQGDVIPALSPLPIAGSAGAPIHLSINGDVFWRTSVTGGTADAYMRNHEPVVVNGQTSLDGRLVTKIETLDSTFAVSQNGRFLVGSVELSGVGDALVFVDFGLALELPGCAANPGKLAVSAGAARVGEQIEFSMDNGHVAGAVARINFSTSQRVPGSDCGVIGPFGEVLISGANRVGSLVPPPWNGTGPTKISITIPPDLALVDAVFFAQGQFRRPGTRLDITLTNALRLEIGAP